MTNAIYDAFLELAGTPPYKSVSVPDLVEKTGESEAMCALTMKRVVKAGMATPSVNKRNRALMEGDEFVRWIPAQLPPQPTRPRPEKPPIKRFSIKEFWDGLRTRSAERREKG